MHPYRYKISLRVSHPTMPHKEISAALGREPRIAWTAGDPRTTLQGHAFEGAREDSYWSVHLMEGHSETPIEQALAACLHPLESRKAFLAGIVKDSGRAELFIGLFGERNLGLELPPKLLGACADLGLALALDIYPEVEP